jgi:hypothetical protein
MKERNPNVVTFKGMRFFPCYPFYARLHLGEDIPGIARDGYIRVFRTRDDKPVKIAWSRTNLVYLPDGRMLAMINGHTMITKGRKSGRKS